MANARREGTPSLLSKMKYKIGVGGDWGGHSNLEAKRRGLGCGGERRGC